MDHLFALDRATNEWCSAATCNRVGSYVCWCPDKHSVFVRKPSGKEGVRVITAHFAHFRAPDGKPVSVCRKGGESVEHVNAKMALKTMAGKFSFAMNRCPECCASIIENCCNGTVVLELRSDDRRWRYDAVYTDANGRATALEVYHSHATTEEKILSTRSKGMRIAEFSASNILELAENGRGGRLQNLLMESELCSLQCKNRVSERKRIRHEREREAERLREEERQRVAWLEQERRRVEKQESEARQREEEEAIWREEEARQRKEEEAIRREEEASQREKEAKQRDKDAKQREKEDKQLREEAKCRACKEAESQKMENKLRQIALHNEAADERWRQAAEKHREACAIKNAKKKKKTKPTPTTIKPQPQPHSPPPVIVKRARRTYNLGSFGFYPPNSRPVIDFCHHGVSRKRPCEHCAQSDAEYEQSVATEQQEHMHFEHLSDND